MISGDYMSLTAPVRSIAAKVELYKGSTLANTFKSTDAVKSIKIERIGESGRFFGFGIVQKLELALIDRERLINISTEDMLKVSFDEISAFPTFYVNEVTRDENTNEISVIAYDILYKTTEHTTSELRYSAETNIFYFLSSIDSFFNLGFGFYGISGDELAFTTTYAPNFEGTETIREALNAVADATQTIYFIGRDEAIHFLRLDKAFTVLTVSKNNYFTLESGKDHTLVAIESVTELGDNLRAELKEEIGVTEYVRNNAFWDLHPDRAALVDSALAVMANINATDFTCEWRGNYYLEIGDQIEIEAKNGALFTSYVLSDVIEYNGGFKQKTSWAMENKDKGHSNRTNLGQALKETYAKVDKVKKEIDIVASETNANKEAIAALEINTGSISATVTEIKEASEKQREEIGGEIAELTSKVNAQLTADQVRVEIQQELSNGVDKVVTATGVTVDENGLTVDKTGSEMKTTISDDGMTVRKKNKEMLVANNQGVNAVNLHATTYLIVGKNSRFEDYGTNRTGCFWIGD